jgi:hypothetical protein
MAESGDCVIVFGNSAEGAWTLETQLKSLKIDQLVQQGKILVIAGANVAPEYAHLTHEHFLPRILDYEENLQAQSKTEEIFSKTNKPYKFLFLNGRLRPHRKYLIDGLRDNQLLDHALWTNLGSSVEMAFTSALQTNQLEPIRLLPPEYEIERAVPNMQSAYSHSFCKHHLFGNTWGDAIVNPACYTDTWFSVVTETIFDYPHTFRTEKIWKPILMAHPFVVAANSGYLRDLKNAGFRTFGQLIDESYDQIDCPSTRMDRIIATVGSILHTGAADFWAAARNICKYNQQHLIEHNRQERAHLPHNLEKYLDERP